MSSTAQTAVPLWSVKKNIKNSHNINNINNNINKQPDQSVYDIVSELASNNGRSYKHYLHRQDLVLHNLHKRGSRPRRGSGGARDSDEEERKKPKMKVIRNGNSREAELETNEVQNNHKNVTFYRGKCGENQARRRGWKARHVTHGANQQDRSNKRSRRSLGWDAFADLTLFFRFLTSVNISFRSRRPETDTLSVGGQIRTSGMKKRRES